MNKTTIVIGLRKAERTMIMGYWMRLNKSGQVTGGQRFVQLRQVPVACSVST